MSVNKKVDGRGRVRYQVYVYEVASAKKIYIGTFDRVKDAEEAEYEARRRLRLGERLKPREEITFDRLARRWFKGLVTVRPSTRVDYDQALRRLSPFIGKKSIAAITRRDIDDIVTSLSGRYSASTVRKTVTIMKMVLRVGIDWDYIDRLPTGGSRMSLPKIRKRPFAPLDPQQVRKLIQEAPEYWRPLYLFLLTSGLRRSEALGVQLQDLDLDSGVVRVRRQLVNGRLVDLKTDAANRRIKLPVQTIAALRDHLSRRPENELDLLFPTQEGRPVDGSNFYSRVWIPTREAAGMPNLRMHDCRHHVASVLLSQGRSVKYVQTVMGHATAAVLLEVYAHVMQGEDDAAAADMDRWLGEEEAVPYGRVRHIRVILERVQAA